MRGAWASLAWAAMLMLLARPVTASAFAGPSHGDTLTVQLCSAHSGGKLVNVELPGSPGSQSTCEKCPGCLGAPLGLTATLPTAPSAAVAYARVQITPTRSQGPAGARAPPRPPGQGPPIA